MGACGHHLEIRFFDDMLFFFILVIIMVVLSTVGGSIDCPSAEAGINCASSLTTTTIPPASRNQLVLPPLADQLQLPMY